MDKYTCFSVYANVTTCDPWLSAHPCVCTETSALHIRVGLPVSKYVSNSTYVQVGDERPMNIHKRTIPLDRTLSCVSIYVSSCVRM